MYFITVFAITMEQQTQNNKINTKVFEELCDAIGSENVLDNIEGGVCDSFDSKKGKPMVLEESYQTNTVSMRACSLMVSQVDMEL